MDRESVPYFLFQTAVLLEAGNVTWKSIQNDLQFGDFKIFDIRVVFYLNSASFQQYEGQIVLNHEVQYILKICLTVWFLKIPVWYLNLFMSK